MQKIELPNLPKGSGKVIRPQRCETCKFAEKQHPSHPNFECHRSPPTASVVIARSGPQTLTAFPLVRPEQWCGAFETKIAPAN